LDNSVYIERIQAAANDEDLVSIELDWWQNGLVNPANAKEIFLAILTKGRWLSFKDREQWLPLHKNKKWQWAQLENAHRYLFDYGFSLLWYDDRRFDLPCDLDRYSAERDAEGGQATQPIYDPQQVLTPAQFRVGGVYMYYAHYEKYPIVALGTHDFALMFMQYAGDRGWLKAKRLSSFGLLPIGGTYIARNYLVDMDHTLTGAEICSLLAGSAPETLMDIFGDNELILPAYKVTAPQQPEKSVQHVKSIDQLERGAVVNLWKSLSEVVVFLKATSDRIEVLASVGEPTCYEPEFTPWEVGLMPYPRNGEYHQQNWVERLPLTLTEKQIRDLITCRKCHELHDEVFAPWTAERRKRPTSNS